MSKTIPVLAWQQTGYDTLNFSYVCDASVDTVYNFNLFGTDPSGGGNSESDVKASVVVIDNFVNNSTPQISFGGATFNVAPYTRKSFPIRKDQKYLSLRVSLGQVILTFANYDIGIPDDFNQYAQSTGQIISSTTFDPAFTAGTILLTNNNLTATGNDGNSQSDVTKNAGKLYTETVFTGFSIHGIIGLLVAGASGVANPTTDVNGVGYRDDGLIYVNNSSAGIGSTHFVAGDTVKMAVNITAGLIWFAKVGSNWNNDPTADPSTGIGGKAIAAGLNYKFAGYIQGNGTFTTNFGGTPFLNPVPAGFTGWY